MDEQVISQRRKRSRSVGSVDSDAPDEYYVDLNDLQSTNALDDKLWSKNELSKIAQISSQMLSEEQEANIKNSFKQLFPTKTEDEIKQLCETMKMNIVKELIKQEKAKVRAAKKAKLAQQLSLNPVGSSSSSNNSASSEGELTTSNDTTNDTAKAQETTATDEVQSPLKNRSPFQPQKNYGSVETEKEES